MTTTLLSNSPTAESVEGPNELACAALESMCFQTLDLLDPIPP